MTWVCQNVRGDPRGTPTKLYGHISKNVDLLLKYAIYAKVIQALLSNKMLSFMFKIIFGIKLLKSMGNLNVF